MAPPRHGKTELVSRRFPAWYLARHPDQDFISASYGADLAQDFGRDVRNIVASPEYRSLFPDVQLAADSQAKNRWHVSGGGGYVAAGVGTAMTGRGAHVFNIDDPVKDRLEAESTVTRAATWDWYRAVAYTRLMPDAAVVLTLTRWHEEDLAGLLLQQEAAGGDRWDKLILPAIGPDGRALWEEAYPRAVLEQIRRTIGEYEWNALYMQEPRKRGGSFFLEENLLVEGQPVETPQRIDAVFAIIDTAIKTGTTHDGTGVVYFALCRTGITHPLTLLDWDYRQIAGASLEAWLPSVFARLESLARECRARMGSAGAFIEDKGSGMVLLQQAASKGWPARAIDSKLSSMGKKERALDAEPHVAAGEVKITRDAYEKVTEYKGATRNHLLSQVLRFSMDSKESDPDDLTDCFDYGIALALGNRAGF